eukprot:scaffold369_cov281-Pinguiococcus_pyrenoidosus.AAC.4
MDLDAAASGCIQLRRWQIQGSYVKLNFFLLSSGCRRRMLRTLLLVALGSAAIWALAYSCYEALRHGWRSRISGASETR